MSQVAEKIAAEIGLRGAIPFERFMELALYCPIHGFYEGKRDSIGAGGDYYTSVSVGSLFGELLAWQFARWLQDCVESTDKVPERVQLVEAGAHGGELAGHILAWLQEFQPELFEKLDYCIVEPSGKRQQWQRETLSGWGAKPRWLSALSELSRPAPSLRGASEPSGIRGVLFSNELLDALPVRRWGWDGRAREWFEWGVGLCDGVFTWVRLPPVGRGPFSDRGVPTSGVGTIPPELSAVVPDGFTLETNAVATAWWQEAAGVLQQGRLVTLDYGLTGAELFAPERQTGTLRAYREHRVSRDVLAHPGEQDITAHVNFSEIQRAGEAAGLTTEMLTTQEQFLTRLVAQIHCGNPPFGDWTESRRGQLKVLMHPEHLGRAFRVLVQTRN